METINTDEWLLPTDPLYKADDSLSVEFFIHAARHELKSTQQGRGVYEDVEYIRMQVPGQRNSVIERPVRDTDKQRFARRYEAWKRGDERKDNVGTPLSGVNWLSPSQKEEYAYFKITTIESLAACADNVPVPTLQGDKRRAKAFVAAMEADAPMAEIRRETASLAGRISEMEQAMTSPKVGWDLAASDKETEQEEKPVTSGRVVKK